MKYAVKFRLEMATKEYLVKDGLEEIEANNLANSLNRVMMGTVHWVEPSEVPEIPEENVPHSVTFKGCEHLDFAPHYTAKRQQTAMGLFWLRDQTPSMVQFCKKRGRIYGCQACLSEQNKGCNDYNEIEHTVQVPLEELDS